MYGSYEIDRIRRKLKEAYMNREYPHRFVISQHLYKDLLAVLDQAHHIEEAQEPIEHE